MTEPRPTRMLLPLLALCVAVAAVATGFARGAWLPNLHNGLLALAFTFVGSLVLLGRPAHREGVGMVVAGLLEAFMFLGRQVAHADADASVGWDRLGHWPVGPAIALTTLLVLGYPEGRLLSRRWAGVAATVLVVLAAGTAWAPLAHPGYVLAQLAWPLALADRWRLASGFVRRQLTVVLAAAAVAALALVVGLVGWSTPVPGLLAVVLIPVAAGWAMENLSLTKVIEEQTSAGRLEGLTPRENDVLELMAEGLSNAAISDRLHLSVKTVEPVITSIFAKLGVPADAGANRRVLAVREYLRSAP